MSPRSRVRASLELLLITLFVPLMVLYHLKEKPDSVPEWSKGCDLRSHAVASWVRTPPLSSINLIILKIILFIH
jgi:hypothetical protein